MIFAFISIIFTALFPFVKIGVSNFTSNEEYAVIVTLWGVASLAGSQLVGCYPRIYPKKARNSFKLEIDFFNFSLVVVALSIFILGKFDIFYLLIVFLMSICSGYYELKSNVSTLRRNRKELIISEALNLAPLFLLVILLINNNGIRISLFFSYLPALVLLILIYNFFGYTIRFRNVDKEMLLNRFSLLVSQSNIFLLPAIILVFFDADWAGLFLLAYYIINLPATLVQVVVNRILYSQEEIGFLIVIKLYLFSAISTLVFHQLLSFHFVTGFIDVDLDSIPLMVFLVFVSSRVFYAISFIKSRFLNVSARDSIKIELSRFILLLLAVFSSSYLDLSKEHLFYMLSLNFFVSGFFYLGIRK
ncbi:hypothetical protein [Enterovibrio norvegicus]|uniref:hypothetical protein n=1 Tax=Enterovibrio norvegicus TaxID=188144 RepID=UPI000C84C38F|nr:hypothetical protein [Enterovibrio norvegicus]PMH71557.1 hypothetical protein BCU62_24815 [Enterovibrio norvegicus]